MKSEGCTPSSTPSPWYTLAVEAPRDSRARDDIRFRVSCADPRQRDSSEGRASHTRARFGWIRRHDVRVHSSLRDRARSRPGGSTTPDLMSDTLTRAGLSLARTSHSQEARIENTLDCASVLSLGGVIPPRRLREARARTLRRRRRIGAFDETRCRVGRSRQRGKGYREGHSYPAWSPLQKDEACHRNFGTFMPTKLRIRFRGGPFHHSSVTNSYKEHPCVAISRCLALSLSS